ncbi:unnamed protein product [Ilex paraguariensis]|uniref:Uncharacterized protein n=1 Tax=Ilex paraguariensis TaxID=185542 RepID=A0ABC8QSM7_9AQUA
MDYPKGKNLVSTDMQTGKVTKEKGKRKQGAQVGNPIMQAKERGSGFRKDIDNLRQPNLTVKNKGVWIQQNKGGELKDFTTKSGSNNTEINADGSLEIEKENSSDHVWRNSSFENGELLTYREKRERRKWITK